MTLVRSPIRSVSRSPIRGPIRTAGHTFVNAEAAALVARFTTPPTDARKALIDNLVGSLKTGGVWSRLDALYLLAAADSQAARQNWIADAYNLTPVSGPTFTADRGYKGDGVSYLNTSFNPTTAPSPKFTLNDASMGVWSRENIPENGRDVGNGSATIIGRLAAAANMGSRSNQAATNTTALGVDTSVGLSSWSRSGSGSYQPYKSGVALTSVAVVSSALANENMEVLRGSAAANSSTKQLAAALFGQSLDATQTLAAYNALNTYLQAVGAA